MNRQVMLLAALAGVAVYFLFGNAEKDASHVPHVDSEASGRCGGRDGGCEPHCPAQGDCGLNPATPESPVTATA